MSPGICECIQVKPDLLTAQCDYLPRHNVGLVSVNDSHDLQTPAGRLMANVLASVAQYETEVRAERVLWSLWP